MKQNLFLRLAQHRAFWHARRVVTKIIFSFSSRAYKANNSLEDLGNDGRSLWGIIRVTATPLLGALFAATALQVGDQWLQKFFIAHDLKLLDDSNYVTFLAAISSIGGVFIGLYYAAIATVGTAMYARVPSNVRDLLAQDRFGIVYMRFLSFLTYLCLILICFRISSLPRIYDAVPVVTLAAGVGIFAFVRLGQRVFHLFDPTELSSHTFEQLQRWMNAVTVGKFRWQDESFQHHAYKQGARAVTVLETLRDLLLKEQHLNGTPLLELSRHTTQVLIFYGKRKKLIPTSSRWYPQVNSFPEWYQTGDMRLSIATESGTTIEPTKEVNREWLEERLVNILLDCLAITVGNAQWDNALVALQYIEYYTTSLAEHGRADLAFSVFQKACVRTTDAMNQASPDTQAETVQKVALAENLASLPIALSLALRKRYDSFRRKDVIARMEALDWSNARSYYKAGFDIHMLSQIEWLAPRLAFERAVEGREVSPSWYSGELAMQPEAQHFVENIAVLTQKLPDAYARLRETFRTANLPWMAAATLSRQWEYWHKLSSQTSVWNHAWDEMSGNRKLQELRWAKFDAVFIQASMSALKSDLLKTMATLQIQLNELERPPAYPDYAGQFLHFSGEAVLDALIAGNLDLIRDVFPAYFAGCFKQFSKMQATDEPSWLIERTIRISSAALLDLMDVSGYALLLSELHQNKALWNVVRLAWDNYLSDVSRRRVIVALITFTESGLGIQPRGILRTNWKRRVEEKFAELPRMPAERGRWSLTVETEAVHPSKLVRLFASRPDGLGYEGIDIFIALYLARTVDGENLRKHWKRHSLADELIDELYSASTSEDSER